MKNLQNIIIFVLVIGIVAYALLDKLESKKASIINQEVKYEYETFNIELPKEFYFCGEEVPLTEPDISEKLDRELHSNVFFHSHTFLVLKRANRWFPKIEAILAKHGLPDDLKYLVVTESSLSNVVSPVGATGFWQIMPVTGKEFGLEINKEVDERYDPIKSTEVACRYMKQAYKKFGSWTLVAASYNMGISGVSRQLKKQKVSSYYDLALNSETARYVFRAMAIKEIFENQEKYKFELKGKQLYYEEEVQEVEVSQNINSLVDFALSLGINYKLLKLHNPWLVGNKLTIKQKGQTYKLKIPYVDGSMGDEHMTSELSVSTSDQDSTLPDMHAVVNADSTPAPLE
ncbi:lytic transglycosylase domain-containing protein [Flammeovirgaceae bacterium SG7u.111]|nr:lytic transglycosylase domain-containing protein [Flammeovirgaceae bacterium SG7u.132]WPO35597.1 lytic transglycosylase domain-containing protein [Flammeovirgaceae bacterium SG7u.111]